MIFCPYFWFLAACGMHQRLGTLPSVLVCCLGCFCGYRYKFGCYPEFFQNFGDSFEVGLADFALALRISIESLVSTIAATTAASGGKSGVGGGDGGLA